MTEQRMSGAAMIIKALADQGVEAMFGYPGGAVLPIYDEIYKQNQVRHILARQEGGAVHAAEGYARSTGKVGVVLVTSGPGATNAVTGLTDALMDSIPIVCLTVINIGDPHYYDEVRDHPWFIPACFLVGIFLALNLFVMRILTDIKV